MLKLWTEKAFLCWKANKIIAHLLKMGFAKISSAVYYDPVSKGTDAAASHTYAAYTIPAIFWRMDIHHRYKINKFQPLQLTLSTQLAIIQVIHRCNKILSNSFFPVDHQSRTNSSSSPRTFNNYTTLSLLLSRWIRTSYEVMVMVVVVGGVWGYKEMVRAQKISQRALVCWLNWVRNTFPCIQVRCSCPITPESHGWPQKLRMAFHPSFSIVLHDWCSVCQPALALDGASPWQMQFEGFKAAIQKKWKQAKCNISICSCCHDINDGFHRNKCRDFLSLFYCYESSEVPDSLCLS